MSSTLAGWMKVISAGAAAAGGVIIAAPLNKTTVVVAILTGLGAMGPAAAALYNVSPAPAPPKAP